MKKLKSHQADEYKHIIVNTLTTPLKSGTLQRLPDFLMPATTVGSNHEGRCA